MSQSLNSQLSRQQQIEALEKDWAQNPRWKGVKRNYSAADVVRLRGSVSIEHTLAKRGAEKLWDLVNGSAKKGYVNSFGAISAGQAMQQAKAGLEAVYLSGWQVAADGNTSETMYPDQSLYAYDSVPPWCVASTTPSSALTKSSGAVESTPATRSSSTTSCPSWPMLKPVSVACSTLSN